VPAIGAISNGGSAYRDPDLNDRESDVTDAEGASRQTAFADWRLKDSQRRRLMPPGPRFLPQANGLPSSLIVLREGTMGLWSIAAVLVALSLFATPARASELEQILAAAAEEEGEDVPGAGILIIKDNQVVDKAVYGVRRLGETAAIAPGDVWNIGSDSKSMTAVMIARLVERGQLSWNAPLESLLPELQASLRPEYRTVTVLQLLSHTSGLPENIEDEDVLNALLYDATDASTAERRLAYVTRALQDDPVGRVGRFSYSNTGFLLAAVVAERATGLTYEALMTQEVFGPLGMRSAGFGMPPSGQPVGHRDGRVAVPRDANPDFFAPAGNIFLSLDDWALFCIDQMNGANGHGALLKPETYALMQTAQSNESVSMGWFILDDIDGIAGPVLYHEGSDGNWFAIVALFPQKGVGMLVAANAGKSMDANDFAKAAGKAAIKLAIEGRAAVP
jgi:CubicO group peptidase (beta-lactamase class C family)